MKICPHACCGETICFSIDLFNLSACIKPIHVSSYLHKRWPWDTEGHTLQAAIAQIFQRNTILFISCLCHEIKRELNLYTVESLFLHQ